jgi:hypothetical protein
MGAERHGGTTIDTPVFELKGGLASENAQWSKGNADMLQRFLLGSTERIASSLYVVESSLRLSSSLITG